MTLTSLLSFNDRFNIFLPHKQRSSIFGADFLNLLKKYPMLWSWLLDMDVPDAFSFLSENVYGLGIQSSASEVNNNVSSPSPQPVQQSQPQSNDVTVSTIDPKQTVVDWAKQTNLIAPDGDYNNVVGKIKTLIDTHQQAQQVIKNQTHNLINPQQTVVNWAKSQNLISSTANINDLQNAVQTFQQQNAQINALQQKVQLLSNDNSQINSLQNQVTFWKQQALKPSQMADPWANSLHAVSQASYDNALKNSGFNFTWN